MRILVDISSHATGHPDIVQVERTPESGLAGATNITGKYAIPVIKGVEFPVDTSSYVLDGGGDVNGGDVSSISYAHLLAMYPTFGNVYFNPLLTANNVDEIDFMAEFRDDFTPPNVYMLPVRVQTGRPPAFLIPGPAGQMPTHTALLPVNDTGTVQRPGLLITKEIDLTTYAPDGADNFMVYWKLFDFHTAPDVVNGSQNDPAVRSILEPDQEPMGFAAYLSPDDGATWCEVGLLEPVGFCDKTKKIRLAFVNRSPNKVYVATYAVLF